MATRDTVEGLRHAHTILTWAVGMVGGLLSAGIIGLYAEIGATRTALQDQVNQVNRTLADIRVDIAKVQARVDLLPSMKDQLEKRAEAPPSSTTPNDPQPVQTIVANPPQEVLALLSSSKFKELGVFSPAELADVAAKTQGKHFDGHAAFIFQNPNVATSAYQTLDSNSQQAIRQFKTDRNAYLIAPSKYVSTISHAILNSAKKPDSVGIGTDDPNLAVILGSKMTPKREDQSKP